MNDKLLCDNNIYILWISNNHQAYLEYEYESDKRILLEHIQCLEKC